MSHTSHVTRSGLCYAGGAPGFGLSVRVQNSEQVRLYARVCASALLNHSVNSEGAQEGKNTEVRMPLHVEYCVSMPVVTDTLQVIVYAVFDVCVVLGSTFFAIRTIHTVRRVRTIACHPAALTRL